MPDRPTTRYLTLASNGGGSYFLEPAGDSLEDAHSAFLDAVASYSTTDVQLVERVPMIIHDGRSAAGRVVVLAERIGWAQRTMHQHGWTARSVAQGMRISESTIEAMFAGEDIKARHVDALVERVQELLESASEEA